MSFRCVMPLGAASVNCDVLCMLSRLSKIGLDHGQNFSHQTVFLHFVLFERFSRLTILQTLQEVFANEGSRQEEVPY